MSKALYPAARAAASRLVEHFEAHAAKGPAGASPRAPRPDAAAVEALIDAAFWASLQREEGYAALISIAYLPPEQAVRPLLLATPLPLRPRALAHLSPAVERPGIHIGVWPRGDELAVWGTTRIVPTFAFVLEVLGPGLLVVKHRTREDSPKFENVAVFEGEQVKVLRRDGVDVSDGPAVLRSLLAPESSPPAHDPVGLLLRLAVSMRTHKRGGALLVVPAGSEAWRSSIVTPIKYAVSPAFTGLADLARQPPGDPGGARALALGRAVEAVAGLTAVDGATLITDRYELLAFGVKIRRPDRRPQVEQVRLMEPVEGAVATVQAPVQLGGTRHISAAQFAQDQPDAVALVASQDGHFTVFAWSARDAMVHAHRVEALLL
jgi:hypothetical protein